MKFTGITNSFICTTAIFLCIELCSCFFLNRSERDEFDFLNGQNCDNVPGSNISDARGCKCKSNKGTLASEDDGSIKCFEDKYVDESKNTCLSYCSSQYFFFSTKYVKILSLLFRIHYLGITEHCKLWRMHLEKLFFMGS